VRALRHVLRSRHTTEWRRRRRPLRAPNSALTGVGDVKSVGRPVVRRRAGHWKPRPDARPARCCRRRANVSRRRRRKLRRRRAAACRGRKLHEAVAHPATRRVHSEVGPPRGRGQGQPGVPSAGRSRPVALHEAPVAALHTPRTTHTPAMNIYIFKNSKHALSKVAIKRTRASAILAVSGSEKQTTRALWKQVRGSSPRAPKSRAWGSSDPVS
jgi:hypothetical protein